MKRSAIIFILFIAPFATSFADNGPRTVSYVDLERYSGTWYEIARYPNSFQSDCGQARAIYTLKSHKVDVLNECRVKGSEKEVKAAQGTAFVVDEQSNSKLKVSFVPLLRLRSFFRGVLDSRARYRLPLCLSGRLKKRVFMDSFQDSKNA